MISQEVRPRLETKTNNGGLNIPLLVLVLELGLSPPLLVLVLKLGLSPPLLVLVSKLGLITPKEGNGMEFAYTKLIVWQKAMELVKLIYKHTKGFPLDERFALTDQIRRAAVSIPSNIAEGSGRTGNKDYAYFLAIARGSLYETVTQLKIAQDLGYMDEDPEIMSLTVEVGNMLTAMLKKYACLPQNRNSNTSTVGLGLSSWSSPSSRSTSTENKDNPSTVGLGLSSWSSPSSRSTSTENKDNRSTVGLGLSSWSSPSKHIKEHL